MKRILGVLFLAGMMVTPTLASAGEQIGVYVAPKLVYGLTQMKDTKSYQNFDDLDLSRKVESKTGGDDTFGGSIAIGYDFDKKFGAPIRAELEYAGFSEAEAKGTRRYHEGSYGDDSETLKQTFTIQTLFVNAYWDIDTGTQFTPYLGAGLGMGFINTKFSETQSYEDFKVSTGSRTVTNFAWNIGAGLGYDMTENWTLDVGYRFVGLGSVKTKTKTFTDDFSGEGKTYGKVGNLYQHQFAVGVRYTF